MEFTNKKIENCFDVEDRMLRNEIKNHIIELRISNNLTQTDFGRLFGKSKTGVATWESGRSLPDLQTLYRIATYFGKSLEYMYGKDEPQNAKKSNVSPAELAAADNYMYVTDGERKLIEELRERGTNIDAKTLEEMFNTILRYHQEKNPIDTDKPQYYEIRLKHYFED